MADVPHAQVPLCVVKEGDVLHVGHYDLHVLDTLEHDMVHRCLFNPDAPLVVTGDQVLFGMHPRSF